VAEYSEFEQHLLMKLGMIEHLLAQLVEPLVGATVRSPCWGCGHPKDSHSKFVQTCSLCDCEGWTSE
jgi:hypothetical protein